jgi:isopentenyl diphosphate isomerase/L-lactate dehydrogenase-like FMN-dependent dehydrogenase
MRKKFEYTRRAGLRNLAMLMAGSPLLRGQQDTFRDHSRIPQMDELITSFDFESVAHAKLSEDAYQNTALGAEGEFTLRRNREVFDWVELVPRAVADVSSVQTATEVLGTKLAFPIVIAPTASQVLLHPDGEMAMHQGATAAANTPMLISFNSSFPVDKIAAAAAGPLWYQLYPRQTTEENREIVERVQAAGCKAIVITVDAPVGELRERALHLRNLAPPRAPAPRGRRQSADPNQKYGALTRQRPWIDWKLLDSFRGAIKVPLLCKAILTAEDALECIQHGWDGIIVSNHGARSNDCVPSTLEVLPEIVDAVRGRVPVLVDSGFRRGSDVLKALALGAKAICLGRAPRYGLAAYGPVGATRVLEIIQGELVMAMAATGRPTLDSIDRSLVRTDFSS